MNLKYTDLGNFKLAIMRKADQQSLHNLILLGAQSPDATDPERMLASEFLEFYNANVKP